MAAGPTDLPHDIIELTAVQFPWMTVLWVAGAVVCATAVFHGKRWSYRRRELREAALRAAENADGRGYVRRLRQMAPEDPFDDEAQTVFFLELTRLVRALLEVRRRIPATDLTVAELKAALALTSAETDGTVVRVLETAERVVFGGQRLDVDQAHAVLGEARRWMDGEARPS